MRVSQGLSTDPSPVVSDWPPSSQLTVPLAQEPPQPPISANEGG